LEKERPYLADIIKDPEIRRSSWMIWWVVNPMACIFI
jgi:hypothetical protein